MSSPVNLITSGFVSCEKSFIKISSKCHQGLGRWIPGNPKENQNIWLGFLKFHPNTQDTFRNHTRSASLPPTPNELFDLSLLDRPQAAKPTQHYEQIRATARSDCSRTARMGGSAPPACSSGLVPLLGGLCGLPRGSSGLPATPYERFVF